MNQGAQTNQRKAITRAENILELMAKGFTYEEVGESMGMTAGNARQIISRHNKRNNK